jgi:hypothetical protein
MERPVGPRAADRGPKPSQQDEQLPARVNREPAMGGPQRIPPRDQRTMNYPPRGDAQEIPRVRDQPPPPRDMGAGDENQRQPRRDMPPPRAQDVQEMPPRPAPREVQAPRPEPRVVQQDRTPRPQPRPQQAPQRSASQPAAQQSQAPHERRKPKDEQQPEQHEQH